MADATDDPTPDAPEADDSEEFDADRAKAKIAKQNSEARALRSRLKDAEAKAAKLDEYEAAQKSEAEKLGERLAAAEARATEAETSLMRAQVAARFNIPEALAGRLQGSSLEDLEADAQEMADLVGKAPGGPSAAVPSRPTEALAGGGDPTETPLELDPQKLAAQVAREF